jgi:hypothetical protein
MRPEAKNNRRSSRSRSRSASRFSEEEGTQVARANEIEKGKAKDKTGQLAKAASNSAPASSSQANSKGADSDSYVLLLFYCSIVPLFYFVGVHLSYACFCSTFDNRDVEEDLDDDSCAETIGTFSPEVIEVAWQVARDRIQSISYEDDGDANDDEGHLNPPNARYAARLIGMILSELPQADFLTVLREVVIAVRDIHMLKEVMEHTANLQEIRSSHPMVLSKKEFTSLVEAALAVVPPSRTSAGDMKRDSASSTSNDLATLYDALDHLDFAYNDVEDPPFDWSAHIQRQGAAVDVIHTHRALFESATFFTCVHAEKMVHGLPQSAHRTTFTNMKVIVALAIKIVNILIFCFHDTKRPALLDRQLTAAMLVQSYMDTYTKTASLHPNTLDKNRIVFVD